MKKFTKYLNIARKHLEQDPELTADQLWRTLDWHYLPVCSMSKQEIEMHKKELEELVKEHNSQKKLFQS